MKNQTSKKLLKFFKVNESKISTFLGLIVILAVIVIAFRYFRSINNEGQTLPEITPSPADEIKLSTNEKGQIVPEGLPKKYIVKQGDNLWKIAQENYTSGYNWVDIARENKFVNPGLLYVGQELTLPEAEVITISKEEISDEAAVSINSETYVVQKGDSLWEIAVKAYADGYKWPEIAKANNIENPNLIFAGNTMQLPR